MKIAEISENFEDKNLEKFLDKLKKNIDEETRNFLLSNFLFRGVRKSKRGPFFIDKFPENRTPTDTSLCISNKLDEYFKSRGFRALRKNSIFATGSIRQASNYTKDPINDLYIIFPGIGFSFLWNPYVEDLLYSYGKFFDIDLEKIEKSSEKYNLMIVLLDVLFKHPRILKNDLEWIMEASSYYKFSKMGIEEKDEERDSKYFTKFSDIWKSLRESSDSRFITEKGIIEIISYFGGAEKACPYLILDPNSEAKYYTDTDFEKAVKSKKEIMITGKLYFAINFNFFNKNEKFILKQLKNEN